MRIVMYSYVIFRTVVDVFLNEKWRIVSISLNNIRRLFSRRRRRR